MKNGARKNSNNQKNGMPVTNFCQFLCTEPASLAMPEMGLPGTSPGFRITVLTLVIR